MFESVFGPFIFYFAHVFLVFYQIVNILKYFYKCSKNIFCPHLHDEAVELLVHGVRVGEVRVGEAEHDLHRVLGLPAPAQHHAQPRPAVLQEVGDRALVTHGGHAGVGHRHYVPATVDSRYTRYLV